MKKLNIFSIFSFNFREDHSKKYLLYFFVTVAILAYGFLFTRAYAETIINTDIIENTTWTTTGSPYIVTNDIYIPSGVKLTIDPGVVVKFDYGYSLSLFGEVEALGTVADKIYFTSYYDDTVGGDTDGSYEDCYYNDYDEEGNGIGEEVCDTYDEDPEEDDWGRIEALSSTSKLTLNNVVNRYSSEGLLIYNGASVSSVNYNSDQPIEIDESIGNSFSGLKIPSIEIHSNSAAEVTNAELASVDLFSHSTLVLKDSKINGVGPYFVSIYMNSSAIFDNVEIVGDIESRSYMAVFSYSSLDIKNSSLHDYDGILVFSSGSLVATNLNLECENDCLSVYGESKAILTKAKIKGAQDVGIIAYTNTGQNGVTITQSEITGNNYGFIVWDSPISIHKNSIHNNLTAGAITYDTDSIPPNKYDFSSNFWGDKTGPIHSTNPLGLGDVVGDNITFTPFLKFDPTKDSISNIMFIPGFQASRLYKMEGDYSLGTEYENKIWEPGILGGPSDMYMDENGESIDKGIYTRDVMSRAKLFGIGVLSFYKSFFEKLDTMVTDGEMANWKPIAYDWRFSPLDIVKRGVEDSNGNISYTKELTALQVPYMIDQLQKLVDTSNNDKVTIVTHSNGGLVAKALIAKLIEMKSNGENDLIDHIDNLIAVAPPLVGTPKATAGILHGYEQGMFFNLFLGRKDARDFGEMLPGAYGLLPSEKYLSGVNTDLILLDSSLDKLNNWRSKYGEAIDTYEELKNFLLDNFRINPSHNDLLNPSILNENIFNKIELLHNTIDNLAIPSNIKVHQVAGWGLPTLNDIRYKSKNECKLFIFPFCLKKKTVLSVDAGFTSGGDSTVVGGSALFGEGREYYLDLEEYNKNNPNKDHANIFEVPYVYDLIHNILKADVGLPSYITSIAPSPVDYTIIKMRSPVAIDIYDENGLHTGIMEGINGEEDILEEGIPNSLYMEIGENKYIVVPKDGDYTLKLDGLSDGIFTLEQEQLVNNLPGDSVVWRDIPTTALFNGEVDINGGMLATSISMDENGDGVFESNLNPIDKSLEQEKDDIIRGSSGSYISNNKILFENQNDIQLETTIKEQNEGQGQIVYKMIGLVGTKGEVVKVGNEMQVASVASVYSQNPLRLKWQLVIIGSLFLLLGGLKFIFKLI